MSEGPRPLFLLSLPRSGSTLAQRILAAHPQIATASEPWVLLPYLYALREDGVYAEYNHRLLVGAVEDFCAVLPNGRRDYLEAVRALARRLYGRVSPPGTSYFLDKTPRYHLVADTLLEAFADDRHVFLWRNPLAVAASMMETWSGGRWSLYRFKVDLFDGLENLVAAYERHAGAVHAVRYEDLVTQPEGRWRDVFRFLDLPFDAGVIERFGGVRLEGRWGDRSGPEKYAGVSAASLDGWKRTMNNPYRKAWCRRYLRWVGRDRLATMGYDLDALLADLDAIPHRYAGVASDLGRGCWGLVRDLSEPSILGRKLRMLPAWHRVHVHK